jgi:hypothetical protein
MSRGGDGGGGGGGGGGAPPTTVTSRGGDRSLSTPSRTDVSSRVCCPENIAGNSPEHSKLVPRPPSLHVVVEKADARPSTYSLKVSDLSCVIEAATWSQVRRSPPRIVLPPPDGGGDWDGGRSRLLPLLSLLSLFPPQPDSRAKATIASPQQTVRVTPRNLSRRCNKYRAVIAIRYQYHNYPPGV